MNLIPLDEGRAPSPEPRPATQRLTYIAFAVLLCLGSSGCMRYWEGVEKQQQESFELADQLEWQTREEETKAKKAAEATPPPDPPLKASDF